MFFYIFYPSSFFQRYIYILFFERRISETLLSRTQFVCRSQLVTVEIIFFFYFIALFTALKIYRVYTFAPSFPEVNVLVLRGLSPPLFYQERDARSLVSYGYVWHEYDAHTHIIFFDFFLLQLLLTPPERTGSLKAVFSLLLIAWFVMYRTTKGKAGGREKSASSV